MRIEAKELRDQKRDKLWEVIPLSTPFLVYLDPANICNLRCKFCPTGYNNLVKLRDNGIMQFGVFTSIVDDFKEFDKKVRKFNLYKEGEPLINPLFIEMVKYLKDANVADQIWTKTNGLKLNPEYNTTLLKSGLDLLAISIKHISSEKYKDICGIRIDYDLLLKNLKDLFNKRENVKIYISICDASLTPEERDKFYNDFEPISDFCAIEGLHGQSFNAGIDFKMGTNNTYDGTPLNEKIVCPLCLHSLVFNYNGTVSLCNEDWTHACIVGDVTKNSVKEIWNGKERFNFMKMHLEGRRSENISCKNCDYISVLPDNVDEHRNEILRKLYE